MNLISNLNFSEKKDAQSIYSSQLYGTFFSVFALVDANKDNGNEYNLESIHLKIMNYKGVVNLGITKAVFEPNKDIENRKGGVLKIQVQALHTMDVDLFPVENCQGQKLNIGGNIQTLRYVKPMHVTDSSRGDSYSNPEQLKNSVFDEEFYYREGKLYDDNMAKKKSHVPTEWEGSFIFHEAGGWICPFAWLLIL